MRTKEFATGEYIVTRVGTSTPSFPFAFPVLDKEGTLKAVLTAVIKLDVFSRFFDASILPDKSFVAITDDQGRRLFYYPAQDKTNPIGKPIKAKSWDTAYKGGDDGIFFGSGSDDLRRIFAYRKIRYRNEDAPYLYIWAGITEDYILAPANESLIRNLIFMFSITILSLIITWFIGKRTIITPIKHLVALTKKISQGNLEARNEVPAIPDEIGALTTAFHDMADSLKKSLETLQEYEHIVSSSTDIMALLDRQFKYISVNKAYLEAFEFAPEQMIGKTASEVFGEEFFDTVIRPYGDLCLDGEELRYQEWFDFPKTGRKYMDITYSPYFNKKNVIMGLVVNGRDITKSWEAEQELLDEKNKLEVALLEIKTLKGILPICSYCKKIRDDKGYWNQIEDYIHEHSKAEFSHGICQECVEKYYPNMNLYDDTKTQQ